MPVQSFLLSPHCSSLPQEALCLCCRLSHLSPLHQVTLGQPLLLREPPALTFSTHKLPAPGKWVGAGTGSGNSHTHHAPLQTGHSSRAGRSMSGSHCQCEAWHGTGLWKHVQEEAGLNQLNPGAWSRPTPPFPAPDVGLRALVLSLSLTSAASQNHLGSIYK